MHDYNPSARVYWWTVFLLGAATLAYASHDVAQLDVAVLAQFLLVLAATAGVALFPVRIPGARVSISCGDIFSVLALVLFGPAAAVIAAAVEGFVGSCRVSKRWTSRLLTPAINSIAMLVAALLLKGVYLHSIDSGAESQGLLLVLMVFGPLYLLLSSVLVFGFFAVKDGSPLKPLQWWTQLAWMALASMGNAVIAGLLYITFRRFGVPVILVAVPVIAMFFVSLHSHYLRKDADERADRLLRNILPDKIADELRAHGNVAPRRHEAVTVLFSDFRGFTSIASTIPADMLVHELNEIFSAFDAIMLRHGVEKIKTVGDAYMAAAGVPEPRADHALRCAGAALEMLSWLGDRNGRSAVKWPIRVGMHSGSVVAGVVGSTKYAYDLWGDTVNTASRLEATSEPGRINVSAYTASLLDGAFECAYRGKLEAKGKGEIDMYFLDRAAPQAR